MSMTEKEILEREAELEAFANEIKERERALQIAEHNRAQDMEANRYDLFFDATNAKHAASPITAVVLTPQPAEHGVSRADLAAASAMIISIGALAAAIVSMLL